MTVNKVDVNPWVLCKCLDLSSKSWWTFSLVCRAIAFAIGLVVLIPKIPSTPIPFVVAGFMIFSELASYRMDYLRGVAQGLRRKLELSDSLGWEISQREMSDLLARCPYSVKKRMTLEATEEPFFASVEKPGPRRAVENVMESSWWSKHLSESMFWRCFTIICCGIIGSLMALVVSILYFNEQSTLSSVARIVTSILLLGMSCGLVRLVVGYFSFSQKSGQIEQQTERLLEKKVKELDAVKTLHDYQIARSSSPIIPEWIWKQRRSELNELWKKYRQKASGAAEPEPTNSN